MWILSQATQMGHIIGLGLQQSAKFHLKNIKKIFSN